MTVPTVALAVAGSESAFCRVFAQPSRRPRRGSSTGPPTRGRLSDGGAA